MCKQRLADLAASQAADGAKGAGGGNAVVGGSAASGSGGGGEAEVATVAGGGGAAESADEREAEALQDSLEGLQVSADVNLGFTLKFALRRHPCRPHTSTSI